MKKNFKRFISMISALSVAVSMFAGISIAASADDGDESNKAFDWLVIDNKFSEINISSLNYWGGVRKPSAPWSIRTSWGFTDVSEGNTNAVKKSFKNIGGNAPYLRGLWTHDATFSGDYGYGVKKIYLTNDKYLSGNFAVELKYIPYNNAQFSNGNWFGALANAGTGFIGIGVGDHKYVGQNGSWGKEVIWDFSHENSSVYPKGIISNPANMTTGEQSYNCTYNYSSGAGLNATIPATTEELPDGFNGYNYARIEFTTDNGVTVLTKRGENTEWKKADIATDGFDYVMKQLRVPESNTQLVFDLHRGFVGVDSVKVYKMRSEYDEADTRFDINVVDQKFSEIVINDLKGSYPDNAQILPPAPWNIKTGYGWSFDNADAVRKSYKNVGSGDKAYLKGLWTAQWNNPTGNVFGDKEIQLYNDKYLKGNFAVELKCIPYANAQAFKDINSDAWAGILENSAYIGIGTEKYAIEGEEGVNGKIYWEFGHETNTAYLTGVRAYTDMSQQPPYHQAVARYTYASGSGIVPKVSATTEELPSDFTAYQFMRLEFTKDKGVTVLTKVGEGSPWRKASITSGDDMMSKIRIPDSNGAIYFNLLWNIIGVDSVKVY